ncbi:sensor histidine kinase [Nocardia albiluteola]|nr:sensor histidine kinase [Nocardia albiluteola]
MPMKSWWGGVRRLVSGGMDHIASAGPTADVPPVRRGWFGGFMATAWLFGLFTPIGRRWADGQEVRAVAAGVCLIAFGTAITASFVLFPQPGWQDGVGRRTTDRRAWLLLAVLGVLSAATMALLGGIGILTLAYVATMSVFVLPSRESARFVVTFSLIMVIVPLLRPQWGAGGAQFYVAVVLPIVIWSGREIGLRRRRGVELARRQLSQLAIVEDRNRVARDVHDILGHSLTVITVKTELALRLIDLDPERAKTEMSDVERLAREALAGVRETVGGLREVTLAGELANARTALHAAGIKADLPDAEYLGEYGPVFGWVLRESVTNIVRHSAASHCTVLVSPSRIEVRDDGTGMGAGAEFGSGLAGLRERVRAEGGTLTLAAVPGGGVRVTATFPEV